MVDALRRVDAMLVPAGRLVDLHPTEAPAEVWVGGLMVDAVEVGDASQRHAAASAALSTVVRGGFFALEGQMTFDFRTYGDTIEELRDYVHENWRDARIRRETVARARTALRVAPPGTRASVLERVQLTVLRLVDRDPRG